MPRRNTRISPRRVALLSVRRHPTADSVLVGIHDYSERHGGWSFLLVRHDVSLFSRCLERFEGDGAIVHDVTLAQREGPIEAAVPLVVITETPQPTAHATVSVAWAEAGRRAGDYFAQRGYRSVGYFDARDLPMTDQLWHGFAQRADEAGMDCLRFVHGPRMKPGRGWQLQDELDDLADWLAHRSRPFALFCADDTHAQRAAAAAHLARLHVPNDIAIVGAGNDETFCQFTHPSLSSVDVNPERLGFEAAALLDRMMSGRPPRQTHILVEPGHVIQRQSSDVFAVHDPEVLACLTYIREHLDEPIDVEQLVSHTRISRSNLQRRFQQTLGYSPGRAIRLARLDRVRHYLSQTRMPLADVAARCGYSCLSHLSRDFRQATGRSPTQFRLQQPVGPRPNAQKE
jgi:LacI family transcriptional regulator